MADDYTCDECDKTFDSQRGLSVHKTQVHDGDDTGDDTSADDTSDTADDVPSTDISSTDTAAAPTRSMVPVFGVGVLVGILLAAGAVAAVGDLGTTAGQVDATTAADRLEQFVTDNRDQLLPGEMDMAVESAEQVAGAPLYNLSVSLTVQNQSTADEFPVFVTTDGTYAFFQPPVDLTRPLDEQR